MQDWFVMTVMKNYIPVDEDLFISILSPFFNRYDF